MLIKILNRLIPHLIRGYTGKKEYQPFFERMHRWALEGMAIGTGGSLETSGELNTITYIKDRLGSSGKFIIFDVGANQGQYTQNLLRLFGNNVVIYAFEPMDKLFNLLQKAMIGIKQVNCFKVGLGSAAQTLPIYSNPKNLTLNSMYNRNLKHINVILDEVDWVEVQTIDAFCYNNNIANIDFLKIDVEGHEWEVLKGAANMIDENKIRYIQFEFGGCNIDSRTYFKDFFYLLSNKFNIYRIVSDGLYPLDSYKENYELFTTTNFLAELR
jgi:FkbM family methyltransferase